MTDLRVIPDGHGFGKLLTLVCFHPALCFVPLQQQAFAGADGCPHQKLSPKVEPTSTIIRKAMARNFIFWKLGGWSTVNMKCNDYRPNKYNKEFFGFIWDKKKEYPIILTKDSIQWKLAKAIAKQVVVMKLLRLNDAFNKRYCIFYTLKWFMVYIACNYQSLKNQINQIMKLE